MTVMMSENHNGHRSVWQQVSTEEPFIWTHYLKSNLTTQNSSHRTVGRGGRGWFSLYITCGGGGGNRSHLGLSGFQGKARPYTPSQTGLPIILCLGKTTLSQDQFPAMLPSKR
jgi:hypothetical protein